MHCVLQINHAKGQWLTFETKIGMCVVEDIPSLPSWASQHVYAGFALFSDRERSIAVNFTIGGADQVV